MTVITTNSPLARLARSPFNLVRGPANSGFDISPRLRAIVMLAATGMSLAVAYALIRGLTGLAPAHVNTDR